jgi:hypothetical protein
MRVDSTAGAVAHDEVRSDVLVPAKMHLVGSADGQGLSLRVERDPAGFVDEDVRPGIAQDGVRRLLEMLRLK